MPDHRRGFLYIITALATLSAPILVALILGQRDVAIAFAAWFGFLALLFGVWVLAVETRVRR